MLNFQMFLTDILFNSPHLRFSLAQKNAVLRWAKDLGASNVPNLGSLETVQSKLSVLIGVPTTEKISRGGNLFYVNEIGAGIAKVHFKFFIKQYSNECDLGFCKP